MPLLRSLILKFVSTDTAKKMEAESRKWKVHCACGNETDYWTMGGIRYKAASRGKKLLLRCPKCGLTWHSVYYDQVASVAEAQPTKS